MSRLNKVLNQTNHMKEKKEKEKKKNTPLPVYDLEGKTVTPEKKKRDFRLAIFLLVFAGVFSFIYLPGYFMKEKETSDSNKIVVNMDTTAIRKSNTALRNHPSEDFDGDGLTNAEETSLNTDPFQIDTDGDAISDYCEVNKTDSDPKNAENIMVDAQTKSDKQNGKNVGSPYKIGNVILWADDYDSKAYGSVVETINGYHFCYFNGYAQFPETDGKYAYRVKNGVHQELPYRSEENAWKISAGDEVELYNKPLDEVVEITFFKKPFYLPANTFTEIVAKVLPDKGYFTGMKKMKIDIEPNTKDNTMVTITKPEFDSSDEYRFTVNSNTLNDLLFVRKSIKEDECCVALSLYNPNKGEYLGIVYGYTYDGNLLIADMNSLEPIGSLSVTESARKTMNETGDIVSISYFDFKGLGFDSTKGDRISFFAATSLEGNQNLMKENTLDKQEKADKEEKEEENHDTFDSPEDSVESTENSTMQTDASEDTSVLEP